MVSEKVVFKSTYKSLSEYNVSLKIISLLSCFNCKIFITYINLKDDNINMLKNSNQNIELVNVDNIGFDIYPFLQVLYKLNLDDYDYVLKLHTKNFRNELLSLNHFKYYGYGWREMAIQPLIKNKKTFKRNLYKLLSNNNCGAICSKKLIMDLSTEMEGIREDEYNFINEHSLEELKKWKYCSGTMFLGRPRYLKPIKDLNLNETFFEGETHETGVWHNPAATIERILGYFIETEGGKIYGVEDIFLNIKLYLIARYHKFKNLLFKNNIN